MTAPRVLVAGIGNIFLGDDGFGVEVAARLAIGPVPEGVRVEDFGIRGIHLAYELLDGYDALILVDAMPMGEPPGTLALIEPDVGELPEGVSASIADAHDMNPGTVLATLASLGGRVDRILVLGCEPSDLGEGIGLSTPVAAAVDDAVRWCRALMVDVLEPIAEESRR